MTSLLRTAAKQGVATPYTARLSGHLDSAPPEPARRDPLVDPLSDRELEVYCDF